MHWINSEVLLRNNILRMHDLDPTQLRNKPCYVHTIGKLFVAAGIMVQVTGRIYQVIV